MSFLSKTDYYGLSGSGSNFEIISSDENASAQTAEAQDEKGDIVATLMYGELKSPTCNYVLKGDATLSGKQLGTPSATNYVMTSIQVDTGAGTPPAITVSGEEVPEDSHCSTDCYYAAPSTTIECCHHAQWLFGLSGTLTQGYYLTQASYTIECDLTKATKDGETVCYDITNGRVTATLTIQGTGSTTALEITNVPNTWIETSPLSQSNPDAGFDTYTVTYSYNLSHPATTP